MRYQLSYCKTQPACLWYTPGSVARMVCQARRLLAAGYQVSIWQHTSSGARRLSLSAFADFLCV